MKKTAYFTLVIFMLSVMMIGFTGCGKSGDAAKDGSAPVQIRLATVGSRTNPLYLSIKKFGDLVQEAYGDKVKVEIYPDGQLGNEKEMGQQMISGALQGAVLSGAVLNQVGSAPEVKVYDIPYLYNSLDQVYGAYKKVGKKEILGPACEKTGFKLISLISMGSVALANNARPVESPADLKGLKIRSWADDTMLTTLKEYGANPVNLPYSECIPGLQQGQIDGLITTDMHILYDGVIDAVKYITDTRLQFAQHIILVDLNWFNSLPADMQKKLEEIGDQVTDFSLTQALANKEAVFKELAKKAEIRYLTPAELEVFEKAAEPAKRKVLEAIGDKEYNMILEALK